MDINAHARPHLEVHSRSKGHSAVAGCAYRLGLRLYDEKAKVWHDYRKRELGEEIVRALTIAPRGAPAWATDPSILWNKVEQAEKRKDAQVARDYRIPIPFGLTDQDAGDLSEEMARFICEELHVPVSMGLHRDADRDALGNIKSSDKQGFHAHLYFPTRPLLDVSDGEEGNGQASMGFGPKLHEFSKQHLGSAFIELLNCRWSELANDYARKSGNLAKYEFKSYKCLGLNLTPQPTLGRSATAMERRGITTNRGDSLKEAIAIAKVYEKAHASALKAQHDQAVRDVAREASKRSESQPGPKRDASSKPSHMFGKWKARGSQPIISARGSLAYRLKTSAPTPKTKAEFEDLERSLVLVEALDKAFAVYHELMNQLNEILKAVEISRSAKLDAEFQADRSRERRNLAKIRLTRWEDDHRFRIQMFATTTMGGLPLPEHQRLRDAVRKQNELVQALKQTIVKHSSDVTRLDTEANALQAKQVEALATIRNHLVKLHDQQSNLLPEIVKALPESDRALVKDQLPLLFDPSESEDEASHVGLAPSQVSKSRFSC